MDVTPIWPRSGSNHHPDIWPGAGPLLRPGRQAGEATGSVTGRSSTDNSAKDLQGSYLMAENGACQRAKLEGFVSENVVQRGLLDVGMC